MRGKIDTGEVEIPQRVIEYLFLDRTQMRCMLGHGTIGLEQPYILTHLGAVIGKLRQTGIVGLAQLVGIDHRIQMLNRRPGTTEPVFHDLDRLDEILPGRRIESIQQRRHRQAIVRQQLIHRRLHMLRLYLGELGQAGVI